MIDGATTLDELISSCTVEALAAFDDASLARFATAVLELWPRLDAARLRLLSVVEEREAFRTDGARDAVSWLAWRAGERRAVARRELELAERLSSRCPSCETGLAAGRAVAGRRPPSSDGPLARPGRAVSARCGCDDSDGRGGGAGGRPVAASSIARGREDRRCRSDSRRQRPAVGSRRPLTRRARVGPGRGRRRRGQARASRSCPGPKRRAKGLGRRLSPLPRPRRCADAAPRSADGGGHHRARHAGGSDRRCRPAGFRRCTCAARPLVAWPATPGSCGC